MSYIKASKILFFLLSWSISTSINGQTQKINFKNLKIKSLEGKTQLISDLITQQNTVFIFFSPSCPLCQSYSLTLRELEAKFKNQKVKFIGVFFPEIVDNETIKKFLNTYQIDFEILLDKKFKLAKTLKAQITPEVFVINQNSALVYSGKIDNWAYSLGKKRVKATEFYLQDAIESTLQNRPVPIAKTEAVGCFIEMRK
jgi:thiol-disulfide isomerase/thioredoxin